MSSSDGVHTKSLEEWINDGGWQDNEYYDWKAIDYYVSEGWLTEHDRDLLHAKGSMVTTGADADQFDEVDAAVGTYEGVREEHEGDYESLKDQKSTDMHAPGANGEPAEGVDYFEKLPDTEKSGQGTEEVGSAPKVPDYGGSDKGGGKVAVNHEAIKTFSKNMESLRTMLEKSKGYVGQIDAKAGCFNVAYELNSQVNAGGGSGEDKGAAGLKNTTLDSMTNAMMTLYDMQDELKKVLDMYENGEELNKVSTDKLDQLMNESYQGIDKMKSAGQQTG